MQLTTEKKKAIENEVVLTASRSSGPGGQNVNKVNSRIELRFSIGNSGSLTVEQKELIRKKLFNRINSDDELILFSESERSQLGNRDKVISNFLLLIESALKPVKKRVKTSPTAASKTERLEMKKRTALKKQLRKAPGDL